MDNLRELYEQRKKEYDQAKIAEGVYVERLVDANRKVSQSVDKLRALALTIESEELRKEVSNVCNAVNTQQRYKASVKLVLEELETVMSKLESQIREYLND